MTNRMRELIGELILGVVFAYVGWLILIEFLFTMN